MILDRELDEAPVGQTVLPKDRQQSPRGGKPYTGVAIFALFLAVTLALQLASGAFHSEFAGYPDESAHYVTSLMVRQYILAHLPGSPVHFAQEYYAHYPKVAFGHWPPVLYIVQGLWMSLFSSARPAILLELAFTTALLAYGVYSEARRWFPVFTSSTFNWVAVLAGFLTICLPIVQIYTAEEMSENLLTLTCLWSAIYFARFLDSSRWRDSLRFGMLFSLAVLTKGSGWLLVFIPPVALVLTRRFRLLLRPSFWLAVVVVAVLCIPWQLATMHLVAEGWAGGTKPSLSYTFTSLRQFLQILIHLTGPALSVLALIGIVSAVIFPALRGPVESSPASIFALLLGVWVFHALVPAGVEDRKMMMAAPALVLFLFAGALWLISRVPLGSQRWAALGVGCAATACFFAFTFFIPREQHYGYIEAANFVEAHRGLRTAETLVSSDSGGEGLYISEVAMHRPYPVNCILRATKSLANVSFDADHYESFYKSSADILRFLDQHHVGLVVMDTFRAQNGFLHEKLLKEAIDRSGRFQLIAAFSADALPSSGQVKLFRFTSAP